MPYWKRSWFFNSLLEAVVSTVIIMMATGVVISVGIEIWQKCQPQQVHEGPPEAGRDIWITPDGK